MDILKAKESLLLFSKEVTLPSHVLTVLVAKCEQEIKSKKIKKKLDSHITSHRIHKEILWYVLVQHNLLYR